MQFKCNLSVSYLKSFIKQKSKSYGEHNIAAIHMEDIQNEINLLLNQEHKISFFNLDLSQRILTTYFLTLLKKNRKHIYGINESTLDVCVETSTFINLINEIDK